MKSLTYKERKNVKTYISVTKNGVCIGIFGSLKTAIEAIKDKEEEFYSYWTLIRKEQNPLIVKHDDDIYVFSRHKINELNDSQINLLSMLFDKT